MNTLEGNKLIAEFMGATLTKWRNEFDEDCEAYRLWGELYPVNLLNYHHDWNWLMPVVENINSDKFYVTIDSWAGVEIYDRSKRITGEPIVTINNDDKQPLINLVYEAVVQFIQWCQNSQKSFTTQTPNNEQHRKMIKI